MKKTSLLALSAFILSANGAFASGGHIYANAVSAHNITAIQHSIMTTAMQTFEGTASAALGGRAHFVNQAESDKYKYGTIPMYGWPRMYGEYGDDGTMLADDAAKSRLAETVATPQNQNSKIRVLSSTAHG